MSEEQSGGSLKNTILGVLATILTAAGGVLVTQFENLFGGGDAVEQTAPGQPQIIINNTQQGGGGGVVRERVVEKPVIVPIQTAAPETVKVEEKKPSSRDRLLNRNRE
jgi:hypothetical protein